MPDQLLIAIDGPAASGKTTLARNLSAHYGIPFIPSGNLYRAVTAIALAQGIDPQELHALETLVKSHPLRCDVETGAFSVTLSHAIRENLPTGFFLNGLEADLRTPQVNASVAVVSAHPAVRDYVTALLRNLGGTYSCIVEGRDIGTVVFPYARFKVFLDAPSEIRQARRAIDGEKDCITSRDRADSNRAFAPLAASSDAFILDMSKMTIDGALVKVSGWIDRKAPPSSNCT